ncbi:hypothetical protein HIM_09392 [Hirsutella minnesotensis 3608]|uniref:Transposase Tc1-like domain-containing protein n=1 Tax=Hirsutella minnesotensis 3608 TaxID=1043627 RepID=A0A0F8A357_9HYPO|nr:hypothetical protein HIM_09392 [Hirsutella minnesotensis 3608]
MPFTADEPAIQENPDACQQPQIIPRGRRWRLDSHADLRHAWSPSPISLSSCSSSPSRDRSRSPSRASPIPIRTRSPLRELQQQLGQQLVRSKEVTRDDKVGIRALHTHTGWSHSQIGAATGFTRRQVQRAISGPLTPRKIRRRRSTLTVERLQQLQEFLDEDPLNRDINWQDLRFFVPGFEGIGITAITRALEQLGYSRRRKKKAPKSTQAIRTKRLDMARLLLQQRPEPEDWINAPILFSDETWARNTATGVKWVTIHETEDPASFQLLRHKGKGWMF